MKQFPSMILLSSDFRAAFRAWRMRSESTLPTRVNMRQRAYFMVRSSTLSPCINTIPPHQHYPPASFAVHHSVIHQVLRVERTFLKRVMSHWELLTQELK
jgi:hypothetical protein